MTPENVDLHPILALASAEGLNAMQRRESSSTSRAIAACDQAIKLLKQLGISVPLELYNNVGVLHWAQGNVEQAEEALLMPFSATGLTDRRFEHVLCNITNCRCHPNLMMSTLRMNLAYVCLKKGKFKKVQQLAVTVELKKHVNFVRAVVIRKHLYGAAGIAEIARRLHGGNPMPAPILQRRVVYSSWNFLNRHSDESAFKEYCKQYVCASTGGLDCTSDRHTDDQEGLSNVSEKLSAFSFLTSCARHLHVLETTRNDARTISINLNCRAAYMDCLLHHLRKLLDRNRQCASVCEKPSVSLLEQL